MDHVLSPRPYSIPSAFPHRKIEDWVNHNHRQLKVRLLGHGKQILLGFFVWVTARKENID